MGVSLRYDANMAPELTPRVIDCSTFQIASGAALAVHIENDVALASSFPSAKNNKWTSWCKEASAMHQRAIREIAQHVSGPWYHPSVGNWLLALNGRYLPLLEVQPYGMAK